MCFPKTDFCLTPTDILLLGILGVAAFIVVLALIRWFFHQRRKENEGFQAAIPSYQSTSAPPVTQEIEGAEETEEAEEDDSEEEGEEDDLEEEDSEEEPEEDVEKLKVGDLIELDILNSSTFTRQIKVMELDEDNEEIDIQISINLPTGYSYISHQLFLDSELNIPEYGFEITYREPTGDIVCEPFSLDEDCLDYGGWSVNIIEIRFKTS